jgi:hypothetical protein
MIKIGYTKIVIINLIFLALGLQSCYKDKFDFNNINDNAVFSPQLGLPVAYGNVTLRNLVTARKDTLEFYNEGQDVDTMIRLVYNIDTISKYKASQFLKPPRIEPFTKVIKMPALTIPDQNSDVNIPFGTFLTDNFPNSVGYYTTAINNPLDLVQKSQDQSKIYQFPSFGSITWVYPLTGTIIMTLTNNYNVPLTTDISVETNLSAIGQGVTLIKTFHFNKIQPGATAKDSIDVSGIYVSNVITYKFINSYLEAYHTDISMNNTLGMSLKLGNLTINSGKAVIPAQVDSKFTSADTTIYFTLDTYKGKKLTLIDVYKGALQFNFSIVPGMNLTLDLPSVLKNGKSVSISTNVLTPKDTLQIIDISGYSMNLATNPSQPYNSIPVHLKYNIDSKGQSVSFDNKKDFKVTITNPDSLQFELVKGNMGHDTVDIGNKSFNYNIDQFIGNYFNGNVKFTDPRLYLNFINSVGMSAATNLQLTGQTKDGKTLALFKPGTFNAILSPQNQGKIQGDTAESSIAITKDNSSIVDFISFLPHTMLANGQIITNYGLTDDKIDNYITRQSIISAQLHAELPLKFSMADVVLLQDFPIKEGSFKILDSLDNTDEFKIIFYGKNQFPLDVTVKLSIIDSTTNSVLDTLVISIIKSAPADASGKVLRTQYTRHREEVVLSQANNPKLVQNLKKANKIRLEAKLNTYNQKSITIYTYYSIGFQLGIDAKVKYTKSLGIKKK